MIRKVNIAYVEIAVGIVGTAASILTAPSFLEALARISTTQNLPSGFSAIAGAVATFSVLFVLATFLFLIALGLSLIVGRLGEQMSATRPMLTATMAIGSLLAFTVTVTMAALETLLWVPTLIAALTLAGGAIAASTRTLEPFGTTMALGAVLFVITGFGVLGVSGALSSPNYIPYQADQGARGAVGK